MTLLVFIYVYRIDINIERPMPYSNKHNLHLKNILSSNNKSKQQSISSPGKIMICCCCKYNVLYNLIFSYLLCFCFFFCIYKDSQFNNITIKSSKIQLQNKTQNFRKYYTFLNKVCTRRGHININNNNNNDIDKNDNMIIIYI